MLVWTHIEGQWNCCCDWGACRRTGSDVYSAEVYPVMGLRAGCNAQQQLVNISNRCWPGTGSSKATGPLLVEGRLRLRDGPSQAADSPYPAVACDKAVCQDQSFNQQVTEWLGAAVRDLLKELGISTDAPVQHAITSCKVSKGGSNACAHHAPLTPVPLNWQRLQACHTAVLWPCTDYRLQSSIRCVRV